MQDFTSDSHREKQVANLGTQADTSQAGDHQQSCAITKATEVAPLPSESQGRNKPSIKDSPWIIYTTLCVTLLSFSLNAYLLYDKLTQRSIEQPPPLLSRIQMTILKSTVLDAVAAKQPTLVSLFPNPGIVETEMWKKQSKAADSLSPIEKEARRFSFLVVRNPSSSLAYNNIRLTSGSNSLAMVETLPPASTRLILLDAPSLDSRIDASYRIVGSSKDQTTTLAARSGTEVVMLADMSMSEINSLAGIDDRVRLLLSAGESSPTGTRSPH